METKTLILRFRDLVTNKGETIQKHANICKEKGFVWWGWWNKAGEQVPSQLFSTLNDKIGESELEIFLLDTGRLKIYNAKCTEIYFSHKKEETPSPDIVKTPEYYRDQKYLAWFKLSEIDENEAEEALLKKYVYVQVK